MINNRIIELSKIVEAILYVVAEPISFSELAKGMDVSIAEIEATVDYLKDLYNSNDRGLYLKTFNNNVQFVTNKMYAQYIERVLQPPQKQSLTNKAMETLAIIAYKQPITKLEIEQIRGVKSDYSIQSLVEKGLIYVSGQKECIGSPNLYATTDLFLSHFNIGSLSELPPLLPIEDIE